MRRPENSLLRVLLGYVMTIDSLYECDHPKPSEIAID
jgi:hypothetical protein